METEKQRLRKEMSGRRNRLTAEEICRKSGQIFDRLTALDIYRMRKSFILMEASAAKSGPGNFTPGAGRS